MTFFDSAFNEVREVTPEIGYNICSFDDFAPLGEKLTILYHADTWNEAQAIAQSYEINGGRIYIYGEHDNLQSLLNNGVDMPSSIDAVMSQEVMESIPYPYQDQNSKNYIATGAPCGCNVPPAMNAEGHLATHSNKLQSEENQRNDTKLFGAQMINETNRPKPVNVAPVMVSQYGRFTRTKTNPCKICDAHKGKVYDLSKEKGRPVPPSEGTGYTTTHPNCHCYFDPVEEDVKPDKLELDEKEHINHVRRLIGQRARHGKLHTVWQDGKLSKRTRKSNPLIRETIESLQGQFNWITPEYVQKIQTLQQKTGGIFLLIRAAAETFTDHRGEGIEPYVRKLTADEIMQFGRTGIGKESDINHLASELGDDHYRTDGRVLDAEFDPLRKELQILHYERDPEIIEYLRRGDIQEVSINAGRPRTMEIEPCESPEGKCMIPRGLILGELDGIAFTYVVSNPKGIMYHGRFIPKATAGVRTTALEIL